MKYLILSLFIILIATSSLATESLPLAAEPLPLGAEPISMWPGLLRTSWALLVVIGLILCIYGLMRKRFGMGALQQGNIKIIETKHIMPKSSLALVEINDRQLLIGVSPNRISFLADITDKNSKETRKTFPDFKTILKKEQ